MTSTRKMIKGCIDFRQMLAIPDVASPGQGPIVSTIVKTAGSPTATIAGGKAVLALDSDDEVESVAIHTKDLDPLNAAKLQWIRFRLKGPVAAASAVSSWFFGLMDAFNAAPASSTKHIFLGTNDDDGELKLWADDNVGTTIAAKPTGLFLDPSNELDFVFNFVEGILSVAPPGASKGAWSDVHIFGESLNALGGSVTIPKRRVLASTSIDLSLDAGLGTGYNPFVMVKKASGETTDTVTVETIEWAMTQLAG